jgi:hypothetical protein
MSIYPYRYHPVDSAFSGAWHLDYSVSNPSFIVASCAPPTNFDPRASGYSTDGGFSWTAFPTLPLNSTDGVGTFGIGEVHAGSPGNILWVASGHKGAYYTHDYGSTWTSLSISGVTNSTLNQVAYYQLRRCAVADKATADIFYLYAYGVWDGLQPGLPPEGRSQPSGPPVLYPRLPGHTDQPGDECALHPFH